MTKCKKFALVLTLILMFVLLFSTTAFAAGTGDVAGAIQGNLEGCIWAD